MHRMKPVLKVGFIADTWCTSMHYYTLLVVECSAVTIRRAATCWVCACA